MTTQSSTSSRRQFLKQAFGFSAAAALARGTTASLFAQTVAGGHHLLAIGDFGSGNERQCAVAAGMKRYVDDLKLKPDALVLVGDNFYTKDLGSVKAERWQTGFEEMYPASHFPGPCWAVLGNHDYHNNAGGEKIQLAYAAANPGTRWTMPAKWHRMDFPAEKPLVTFLCLDSNLPAVSGGKDKLTGKPQASMTAQEEAEQLAWFQAELAKPRARYTAVIAHHPLYTNGKHGDIKPLIAAWDGLLRKHGVHFYFCGHDHDLQHLEFEDHPTSFVITGAGGARLYELKENGRGPFAQMVYGFTHLQVSEERFLVRHLDANRKLLHTFSKTPQGKLEIL